MTGSRGCLPCLAVVGLLSGCSAGYLLVRDTDNLRFIRSTLDEGAAVEVASAVEEERNRMQAVVGNDAALRNMLAALALVAAILIAFSRADVAHAVTVGQLLMALSGVIVDRYSAERAVTHLGRLGTATD